LTKPSSCRLSISSRRKDGWKREIELAQLFDGGGDWTASPLAGTPVIGQLDLQIFADVRMPGALEALDAILHDGGCVHADGAQGDGAMLTHDVSANSDNSRNGRLIGLLGEDANSSQVADEHHLAHPVGLLQTRLGCPARTFQGDSAPIRLSSRSITRAGSRHCMTFCGPSISADGVQWIVRSESVTR
jgi:hypothetical protein